VFTSVQQEISGELDEIRSAGLFKTERVIDSPAGAEHPGGGRPEGSQPLREQLSGPG
jgi:hypothetical protein